MHTKIIKKSNLLIIFLVLFHTVVVAGFAESSAEKARAKARRQMVEHDLRTRGIEDASVLKAMQQVPRHLFVPENRRRLAYGDFPLPIGKKQTISQPYIVAFMTQSLNLKKTDKILEIGTGSGYQAAVLAEIVARVYTIEIIPSLAKKAAGLLQSLAYTNIEVKAGDGFFGWPEAAPFDAIILTCSAEKIPQALIDQLKEGGRIILPLGRRNAIQSLILATKRSGKLDKEKILPVRFVPMTGEIEKNE